MEKRFLLALVLCFLILMVYQSYMEKQQQRWKAQKEASEPEAQEEAATVAEPASEPGIGVSEEVLRETADRGASRLESFPGVPCQETVTVDTLLFQAIFCSESGRPMSWRLKRFYANKPCECGLLGLSGSGEETSKELGTGRDMWVERIHAMGPDEYPLGLEISTGEKRRWPLRERLVPDRSRLDLHAGDPPGRVSFVGQDARGREIRRTYTFHPDRYLVDLDIEMQASDPAIQQAGLGLKLTERIQEGAESRYTFAGFMGFVNGRLEKEKKLGSDDPRYYVGQISWAGFSDKYFLNSLVPVGNPVSSMNLVQLNPEPGEERRLFVSRLIYNIQPHVEAGRARFSYSLYVGPKDLDVLKASGHSLERSIDLGWFGFIAQPLLVVLKFFHRYTQNYGIAIILLTIIIKILFHPLTRRQYESMRELQKLQPKMQAIREKFKNDKEKMNKEVMDLYRTHKINPLGGCWPLLLQIPVFFALYKALLNSIELRHAPFAFWIQDLSEKDPCYITPIIMGLTMFLQQRMTPAAGDPSQQKMMMFMPVIFTFLFLNFPSGLVLYWLVNNVLTIGQQYISQKRQH
jgi:YidC/Oxa1 family membrane protein insertase